MNQASRASIKINASDDDPDVIVLGIGYTDQVRTQGCKETYETRGKYYDNTYKPTTSVLRGAVISHCNTKLAFFWDGTAHNQSRFPFFPNALTSAPRHSTARSAHPHRPSGQRRPSPRSPLAAYFPFPLPTRTQPAAGCH